jgi:hypothetical protein
MLKSKKNIYNDSLVKFYLLGMLYLIFEGKEANFAEIICYYLEKFNEFVAKK